MALDVKVTINLAQPIGKVGSWFPLVYFEDELATAGEPEYKEFRTLAEVTTGGYVETSDVYKIASLIFMQDNAPEKIAIMKGDSSITDNLAKYANKSWRQLIVAGEFDTAIATWTETTNKMYFASVSDVDTLSSAASTIGEYNRTFVVVYADKTGTENAVKYPEAAIVGATAGYNAGSFTYKNQIIKGVHAVDISDTDLEAIHTAHGVAIVEKAGDTVTSDGTVVSGEYADVVDSKDYIISNISYKVQKIFNNAMKLPYTNAGIGMLEAAVLEALVDGYNNGMIAENDDGSPAYTVNFALRSATTETDRANRNYPYGLFSFALSGAIHTAEIKGEITV